MISSRIRIGTQNLLYIWWDNGRETRETTRAVRNLVVGGLNQGVVRNNRVLLALQSLNIDKLIDIYLKMKCLSTHRPQKKVLFEIWTIKMGKYKNFIFKKLVIISYKNRNIIGNEDEMSQNRMRTKKKLLAGMMVRFQMWL